MAGKTLQDMMYRTLDHTVRDDGDIKFDVTPSKDMVNGFEAFTTEPFTSINSKTGTQYAGSIFVPTLAAGASLDIVFIVGSQPVLMKDIIVEFDSLLVSIQWLKEPTYSGGTVAGIFNMNDAGAVPHDTIIYGGATVTDPGTPVGPKVYSLGSSNVGSAVTTSENSTPGVERVLAPDATYLYRITNEDSAPARVSTSATWYRGPLSTDLYNGVV